MNTVNGETVTVEVIEEIVNEFDFADEQYRKAAIDKINDSIYEETDLDELREIAEEYSKKA